MRAPPKDTAAAGRAAGGPEVLLPGWRRARRTVLSLPRLGGFYSKAHKRRITLGGTRRTVLSLPKLGGFSLQLGVQEAGFFLFFFSFALFHLRNYVVVPFSVHKGTVG